MKYDNLMFPFVVHHPQKEKGKGGERVFRVEAA